uniref:Uncharacterized protein n=1 Tax=Tanacetum cinerariifolium TaxID=118510 RepID=A0A699H2F0_TANCI|nr:hypothetical protein [Tanacetum cinerariifolium]
MSSPGAPSTPSYSAGHSTPPSYSSGPSTPPSYSSRPSTPINYSLGSSKNKECLNFKHLRGKISVLKATMDMHMHPEQHTVNLAALFHEDQFLSFSNFSPATNVAGKRPSPVPLFLVVRLQLSEISESLNLRPRSAKSVVSNETKTKVVRMYSYVQLGEKLRSLRIVNDRKGSRKGKTFSLAELNERLTKLRELDDK